MIIDGVVKQQVLIIVTSHHSHHMCLSLFTYHGVLVSLKSCNCWDQSGKKSDLSIICSPTAFNMEPLTYPLRNECQYENH